MVLLDVRLSLSETSNVTTDMGADSEGTAPSRASIRLHAGSPGTKPSSSACKVAGSIADGEPTSRA